MPQLFAIQSALFLLSQHDLPTIPEADMNLTHQDARYYVEGFNSPKTISYISKAFSSIPRNGAPHDFINSS